MTGEGDDDDNDDVEDDDDDDDDAGVSLVSVVLSKVNLKTTYLNICSLSMLCYD